MIAMRAEDLMTRPVVTVPTGASIRDAAAVLTTHGIAAAPVIDEEGRLIGMVAEGDLIDRAILPDPRLHARRVGPPQQSAPSTVDEVMTKHVLAVPTDTDAADLARLMVDRNIRSIPVVDGDRVVGIVARRDMLRSLVRSDDTVADDVRSRLSAYYRGTVPWQINVDDSTVTLTGPTVEEYEHRVIEVLVCTTPGVRAVAISEISPQPAT
jgi:CBS domain-containing protein